MNYLKIFHKLSLLFVLVVLSSCVSSSPEIFSGSDNNLSDIPELPETTPEPPGKVEEERVIPYTETVTDNSGTVTVDQINWVSPEASELSLPEILPVVEIREVAAAAPVPLFSGKILSDIDTVIVPEYKEKSQENSDPALFSGIQSSDAAFSGEVSGSEPVQEPAEKSPSQSITERNMTAPAGTELDITLSGKGWTFLPDGNIAGTEYVGRKYLSGNTVYTFLPVTEGVEQLVFQYQDLGRNIFRKEIIVLEITGSGSVGNADAELIPEPAVEPSVDILPLDQQAAEYLAEDDMEGLASITGDILESDLPDLQILIPEIADRLYKGSRFEQSALLIENYFARNGYNSYSDYFIYLLGKIYESDTPLRDERISAAWYRRLIDEYPGSFYWEESQKRYRFLKRRYIDIR